jgi:hypothetical protein
VPQPDDLEDLHLLAEYHTACRALRRMGWAGVGFGIFNIGLGMVFTFYLHPINAVLVLIGLLLFASGVWCLVLPGAEGVICNGIALIAVGLWNLFVTVINLVAGAGPQIWWAVIGIFLIATGVQCFRKYARFSAALRHGASKEDLARMDRLVKSILKADSNEDEDIIGFSARTFNQQLVWRGRLGRNVAMFVEKKTKEVLVAGKEDVSIEPHGKVLIGQTLKAAVRIREHKWEALVSPRSFDRFRDWKFSEDDDEYDRDDEADAREPGTGIRMEDDGAGQPPTGIKDGKREKDMGPS